MFDSCPDRAVDTTFWSAEDLEWWWSLPPHEREDAEGEDPLECGASCAEFDELGPLDEIGHEERLQSMSLGRQMRSIAAHVHAVVDDAPWYCRQKADRAACAEIALRMGMGRDAQTRRIGDALRLVDELPATLAAMCEGSPPYAKVRVILDETINIQDRAILARVEAEALNLAPGFPSPRLRDKIRRLIERIDAEALKKRVEAAPKERSVQLWREPDGMAKVCAFLPVEQALSVFGVIDVLAQATKGSDEERTIDQIRADTFVDLICHPGDQPPRVTYEAQILVPVGMMLGRDVADPARLADGTAIPEDLARAIATDSRWRLLLTDPGTRHLLDLGAHTYAPGNPLTRFIHARDRHCRWPGCARRAKRCELDHTIKFHLHGGLTIVINMSALCKKHHEIKDMPGWDAIQDSETGAITFITPGGDRYTTRPPTLDGEEQPVEVVLAGVRPQDDIPPY